MRIFVKLVIVGLLIGCTNICLQAQNLELNKLDKVKSLDHNSDWYFVQKLGAEDECCSSRRYLGQITEFTKDSIQLKVQQFESRNSDEEKSYLSLVKFNTKKEFPIYTIAKSDIKNIQEKESKLSNAMTISGGLLFFTSLVTAVHAMIVEDDDRKLLFISAGIQFGTSVTLLTIGGSKNKKYKISEDAWQF